MGPLEPDDIRKLADRARHASPSGNELADAVIGDPLLVIDGDGEPEYWFVPFIRGEYASGFAHVSLSGSVQRIGTFGSSAADTASAVAASFFIAPPEHMLAEIRSRYPGADFSAPVFSFDRVPIRWGWRLQVGPPLGDVVFVMPNGLVIRKAEQ